MRKCMLCAALGFAVGIAVGYVREEEISDMCRQSKKTKKRMKKQYHKAMDQFCDCIHMD